ncbi:hypothetical protein TepRe1_1597 [Tepidanaerobacter acetatoxydans Re1]|nr:hypothetical protein TepRe1_1597 [Tepidanaerobacter acetatoxydans Re1]
MYQMTVKKPSLLLWEIILEEKLLTGNKAIFYNISKSYKHVLK